MKLRWEPGTGRRRRIWPVSGPGGEYYFIRGEDLWAEERPLAPSAAEAVLERLLSDTAARPELLELYECAGGPPPGQAARINDAVIRGSIRSRLRRAFETRELVLLRLESVLGPGGETEPPGPKEVTPPPRETRRRTWIEVRLVDMEGNPVPNKHYLIRLPGGQIEEGFLDGSGRVRLDGIDAGSCMISFPDLDLEAWERA